MPSSIDQLVKPVIELCEHYDDPFNRPRHRGDFGLRVPPPQRAMREFLTAWRNALPQARKESVACRDYVMAKIAYVSGVRAAELCTGSRAGGAAACSRTTRSIPRPHRFPPVTPCVPWRSPGSTWPTPASPAGHWRCAAHPDKALPRIR
ncbi:MULTISPECIES: hypothetical protein [unclassified Streptomyces]|uniref:hypothetical protein n=1 Tax=unclassified Streptomyces TaxID=2593676 RepID=UPI0018765C2A|nr:MULTISPECIES: hypothetical protein [unclassified Streptomyces]